MDLSRRLFLALTGAAAAGPALAQSPAPPAPGHIPSDDEIRRALVERIDVQKDGVGIVVGLVGPKGRRLIAYGAPAKGDPRPLTGDTVFEIGSMTKVFTSLVLADMDLKGEVSIADPVAKYLPPGVRIPERGGRQITLQDLATHSSGLPRMPGNFTPHDPDNPYADYTPDQLYAFLGGYTLTRDIGATYEYSNLGVGLLGQALARRAGVDYETLVKQRITGPLHMTSTAITLTPAMRARLALPYDSVLDPAANWDLPTLAGAGALRSTANDMMTFLEAELGLRRSPLRAAMDRQVSAIRRPAGSPTMTIALGWHFAVNAKGQTIVWHNGGTGGYRTFMGYDPATRLGAVVLTNASTARGGDDLGGWVLGSRDLAPAPVRPPARTTVALTPAQLDALVGRYQLAPAVIVEVTRDGEKLFAQLTSQGRARIFPESPTQVFWKIVDAQGSFELGADGRAAKFTLHQNGRDLPAPRITP